MEYQRSYQIAVVFIYILGSRIYVEQYSGAFFGKQLYKKLAATIKMSGFNIVEELKKLKPSTTNEEIRSLYANWAREYDKDCVAFKYTGHKTFVDIFDQEMKKIYKEERFNKMILDAGAGTGIAGEHLRDAGYKKVDALDISQEMLDIARDKGVYQNLICAALCDQKIYEIETGHYDATISTGAIHVGHVKPNAFDEILRHVKPGGIILLLIEESLVKEDHGYKEKIDEMVANKKWQHLRTEYMEYCLVAGTDVQEMVYLYTYKVLANE